MREVQKRKEERARSNPRNEIRKKRLKHGTVM